MSGLPAGDALGALEAEVLRFLTREARLMDEHRYQEWLDLWTEDALYWIPCNADDIDPARHVSIVYDDRDRLAQRVERLLSGSVLAQDPLPRMRRVIGCVEVEGVTGAETLAGSNFVLVHARGSEQQLWAGRAEHRLRRTASGWQIVRKRILLVNNDQEMPLLQFLL